MGGGFQFLRIVLLLMGIGALKQSMKVLVLYATRAGSTKGIAEFIGKKLDEEGVDTDVLPAGSVRDLSGYDAFVIGSALYRYHWLREARELLSRQRRALTLRPVWLFSSGPTGPRRTDKKGRDLLEVSGPSEIGELRELAGARDHRVFFGAIFPDRLTGATGLFARLIPKEEAGDFRDWSEIGAWARGIAAELRGTPA